MGLATIFVSSFLSFGYNLDQGRPQSMPLLELLEHCPRLFFTLCNTFFIIQIDSVFTFLQVEIFVMQHAATFSCSRLPPPFVRGMMAARFIACGTSEVSGGVAIYVNDGLGTCEEFNFFH